jgi:hypothetical protein
MHVGPTRGRPRGLRVRIVSASVDEDHRVGTAGLVSTGRGHFKRWAFGVVAFMVVAAAVAVGIVGPFDGRPHGSTPTVASADPTSLYTVVRQDLSSQTQVSATLGYAGTYSVVNQAQGTVTALPAVGQVVSEGQVLYQVNGAPVVLLYGATPAYRSLSEGTTGADVAELNAALVALGYATSSDLDPSSDYFSSVTATALAGLQAKLGVTENGTLSLGQAVFEPTAVRVTTVTATLGAPAQPGQPELQATSTTRQVSIALDAAEQSEVAVGDKVTITLPNNETTPGVISSVGTVATTPSSAGSGGGSSGSSNPTITVLVNPTDPNATGTWDQAPVNVTITTGSVSGALVVPVDALLAQSGGGYAVEVVGADGAQHLVRVSLGLFDDADGLVQVSGPGLAAGQRVVVPNL